MLINSTNIKHSTHPVRSLVAKSLYNAENQPAIDLDVGHEPISPRSCPVTLYPYHSMSAVSALTVAPKEYPLARKALFSR